MDSAKVKDIFGGFLLALLLLMAASMVLGFIFKFFLWSVLFLGLPILIGSTFGVFFLLWIYVKPVD